MSTPRTARSPRPLLPCEVCGEATRYRTRSMSSHGRYAPYCAACEPGVRNTCRNECGGPSVTPWHPREEDRRVHYCAACAYLIATLEEEGADTLAQLARIGEPVPRERLLARVSDILRRSGVADAERLVLELERLIPARAHADTPQSAPAFRVGSPAFAAYLETLIEPCERCGRPDGARFGMLCSDCFRT